MTTNPTPNHFRSRIIDGVTPGFSRLLQQHGVPKELDVIIGHYAHGAAITPNPTASYPNRGPHIVLGISASLPPDTSATDPTRLAAVAWADALTEAKIDGATPNGSRYMSFTPPDECDTIKVFGPEATARLTGVKKRYDGNNILSKAYPQLMP
jgi:hypothetical protein